MSPPPRWRRLRTTGSTRSSLTRSFAACASGERGEHGNQAGDQSSDCERSCKFRHSQSFQAAKADEPAWFLKCVSKAQWPPCIRHELPRSATDSRLPGGSRGPGGVAMLELLGAEFRDVGRELRDRHRPARRAAARNGGRSRSRPRRCRPSRPFRTSARWPRRARIRRRSTAAGARSGEPAARPSARRSARDAAASCAAMRAISLASGRIAAKHGELAGVDARRAIFAGLVDAEHRSAIGAPVAGTPAAHRRAPSASGRRSAPRRRATGSRSSRPSRCRGTTIAPGRSGPAALHDRLEQSSVVAPLAVAVQVVKPSKT